MTSTEFNEKYKSYIEDRFGGLEFDIPAVTEYLDTVFQEFVKLPDFKFAQIKLKFGQARFYSTLPAQQGFNVEDHIDTIIADMKLNKN